MCRVMRDFLWHPSAKAGHYVSDSCAARAVKRQLVKETGELFLRALSPVALSVPKTAQQGIC